LAKGVACRKPARRAASSCRFQTLDLLAETLVFAAQTLAIALRLFGALAPVGVLRSTVAVVRLRRFRHTAVMPEFIAEYKPR